jgi:tetratricopeptide (TPR) repeat protein
MCEDFYGKEHPDTAGSYNNIGAVYYDLGNYDKALEYYKQALEIQEKVLSKKHPYTADSYNNVGIVYCKLANYDKALEYHKQALGIREIVLSKEHPDTASSYYIIGLVYYNLDNYDKALYYLELAAEQGYELAYNQLAWTLHLMGKYNEALPWAEKAVEAYLDNPEIIDTLATVYQGLGRYDDALEQFELCLKLKKEQNASNESIHETEDKIATLKTLMKQQ